MATTMAVTLLLAGLLALASGSIIVLEQSPNVIETSVTTSMRLRCSLNDTNNNALIGRRDITQSVSDVHHVTSLVIVRDDGLHVASVSQFSAPQALADRGNLLVTGSVNGGNGIQGYIELSWHYPTQAQAGKYSCEVNALTDAGHSVVFSRTVNVEHGQPNCSQMATYIRDLKVQMQSLQHEMTELKTNTSLTDAHIMASLGQIRHIETGIIDCDHSAAWHGVEGSYIYKNKTRHFQQPYDNPPIVFLTPIEFNDHDDSQEAYMAIDLLNVDDHGFTARCRTWYNMPVWILRMRWISFATTR